MSKSILLRGAKQLLTLRGPSGIRRGAALQDLGIIEDGSVLIRDGVIAALGSSRRLENLKEARDALEFPVAGSIIMPAFVDPNFRFSLKYSRSGGNASKRWRVADFQDATLALMRSCLQHGTMCANAKVSADTVDFGADISIMRQIARISSSPVSLTRTWSLNSCPAESKEEDREIFENFSRTLNVMVRRKYIDAVELAVGNESFAEDVLIAARRANLATKFVWRGNDRGILARLLADWMPRTVACSSTISEQEAETGAHSPAVFVFSPGAEMGSGMRHGMRRAIDAGAAVALSSGHHAQLAPGFSMQIAVSLAVIQGGLTAEEAISAATMNAAHAAEFAASMGSIEVGKRADMLVLTVPHYREISRQFGINHVGMVVRDGTPIYNRMLRKAGA